MALKEKENLLVGVIMGSFLPSPQKTELIEIVRNAAAKEREPETRGEQLRAMSDEQLADALYKVYCEFGCGGPKDLSSLFCDGKAGCITKNGNIRCSEKKVRACILRWLRQPVEERQNEDPC